MTHHRMHRRRARVETHECWIDLYENNGGVVLKDRAPCIRGGLTDVLFFIDCQHLGFERADLVSRPEDVRARAWPIFTAMLHARNTAYEEGHRAGRAEKLAEVRAALELA